MDAPAPPPAPQPSNLKKPSATMSAEDLKRLQASYIHFCIPCYGGMVSEATFKSMIGWTAVARKCNANFALSTMVNESLVTRARNNLVAYMLANPKATHLMFVDADIGFEPNAIVRLVASDMDVVAGLYPKKALPIDYVVNTLPKTRRRGPLIEVKYAGTGFLMVKRWVLEKLIEAMPETKYVDSVGAGKEFEPYMYALFDTMIDDEGKYLSEDWTFCKRIREKLGVSVWVDTEIKLDHLGTYRFGGDLKALMAAGERKAPATA